MTCTPTSGAITVDGAKNKLKAYTDFGNITIEKRTIGHA